MFHSNVVEDEDALHKLMRRGRGIVLVHELRRDDTVLSTRLDGRNYIGKPNMK